LLITALFFSFVGFINVKPQQRHSSLIVEPGKGTETKVSAT